MCIRDRTLAETIAAVADKEIKSGLPIIAVIRSDMAKALGQIMRNVLPKSRPVLIIDSIYVEQNDFIAVSYTHLDVYKRQA